MSNRLIARKAILSEDIKGLCTVLFGFVPTPRQEDIICCIAFAKHKRTIVNCFTRYGKTQSVAIGVALYILLNNNKRIYVISATDEQAKLLRNYMASAFIKCEYIRQLLQKRSTQIDRLKDEMSKKRMTFSNNIELITISAQGEADRLLGHGGDLIVLDESCKIKPEVYRAKVSRMLGDSPDSMLVEISNPWNRDGHYYDHWVSERFHKIHVGWKEGLEEGRITQDFLDEQREQLTPMEFQVLYDSEFPDEAEDSLFSYSKIQEAVQRWKDNPEGIYGFEDLVLGCDVADKGLDKTVIMTSQRKENQYYLTDIYSEDKSENTAVAGRLIEMQDVLGALRVHIDTIGLGVGVVSMVREGKKNPKADVVACHFGTRPSDRKRFLNKKAEVYFRLKKLFDDGLIAIPPNDSLINELLRIKWGYSQSSRIKIIDPDRSPDFADALVYTVWPIHSRTWAIG